MYLTPYLVLSAEDNGLKIIYDGHSLISVRRRWG